MHPIVKVFARNSKKFTNILPFDLNTVKLYVFDFTAKNKELAEMDVIENTEKFTRFVKNKLKQNRAGAGIGSYNEDRAIYKRSKHFGQDGDARTIHLGTDIFVDEQTSIFAPLNGKVHSFKYNDTFGDYGPAIILEHQLENIRFFTLYGHLSLKSIKDIREGQPFDGGERIGSLGGNTENGCWPPHLHFQIIRNMENYHGDYPGVARVKERKMFLEKCPDPNLILNIKSIAHQSS